MKIENISKHKKQLKLISYLDTLEDCVISTLYDYKGVVEIWEMIDCTDNGDDLYFIYHVNKTTLNKYITRVIDKAEMYDLAIGKYGYIYNDIVGSLEYIKIIDLPNELIPPRIMYFDGIISTDKIKDYLGN